MYNYEEENDKEHESIQKRLSDIERITISQDKTLALAQNQLERNEKTFDLLNNTIADLSLGIHGMRESLEKMNAEITNNTKQIESLQQDTKDSKITAVQLRNFEDKLMRMEDYFRTTVESFQKEVKERFEKVEKRLDDICTDNSNKFKSLEDKGKVDIFKFLIDHWWGVALLVYLILNHLGILKF